MMFLIKQYDQAAGQAKEQKTGNPYKQTWLGVLQMSEKVLVQTNFLIVYSKRLRKFSYSRCTQKGEGIKSLEIDLRDILCVYDHPISVILTTKSSERVPFILRLGGYCHGKL